MAVTGTITTGASAITSMTGGSASTLDLLRPEGNKSIVRISSDTDMLTRRIFEFSGKDPVAQISAPGGYTQARARVLMKYPKTLANGKRTVNTGVIELNTDPETTAAEKLEMRLVLCQLVGLSTFADFWALHDMI